MKVLLLEILPKSKKKCVNKDLAGGMGTGTWIGNSLKARIFEFVKKSNVILPNITIAYLAAIFKKANWEVKVIATNSIFDLPKEKADLVLLPVSIVECDYEFKIIKKLKEYGFTVGVYGVFAIVRPEFFLKDADFVIKGEAEAGVLKIVKENIIPQGILEAGLMENIDELPYPDWSQFPIKKYSYFPALNKKPVLTMLSSRGCPYSCSYYCPYTIQAGNSWRARSVENVADEIQYLIKEYGVKAIDFRDAVFTLDRERTIKLMQEIIKRQIKIIWSCETRLDRLDKELIKIMHQAGLMHINVGIESFDSEVLKKSNRLPIEYKHQEEIISYCHKKGITVAAFYILGLENDTEETILKTIEYAIKLNTLVAQFTISTPYPGTCFFDKIKSEGRLLTENWTDFDAYTPVYKHQFVTAEKLLALKEKAFVSYYFRRAYLFKHMPRYFWEKYILR